MKLPIVVVFVFVAAACSATPPTHAPYKVITEGLDLHPKSISTKLIGSLCSVFFLPGKPELIASFGGPDPEGMVKYVDGTRIVTGKIVAIQNGNIVLAGYYTEKGERDGSRIHTIQIKDVAHVIINNEKS